MKSKSFLVVLVACLAGPFVVMRLWEKFSPVAHAAVTPNTMPAQTARYHEFSDNNQGRRLYVVRTFAYREDGAISEIREFFRAKGNESYDVTRTVRLPDGTKYVIQPKDRVVSSFGFSVKDFQDWRDKLLRNPETDCSQDLRGQSVSNRIRNEQKAGVESVGFAVGKGSALTVWYAPSLGCLKTGQTMISRDNSGAVMETLESELDLVAPGAPDPSLFSVPAGYEEVAPSVAYLRMLKRAGASQVYLDRAANDGGLKRQDELYRQYPKK